MIDWFFDTVERYVFPILVAGMLLTVSVLPFLSERTQEMILQKVSIFADDGASNQRAD